MLNSLIRWHKQLLSDTDTDSDPDPEDEQRERIMPDKRIIVTHPHGFCAGVARAVAVAEVALAQHGAPVYALHEIVHNRQVTERLATRGLRVVEQLADVPEGAVTLFSAHGVAPAVRAEARARKLRVLDATCPFVERVHREALRFVAEGCTVFCIGHPAHAEVVGIAGEAPGRVLVVGTEAEAQQAQPLDPAQVAVVSQTTLNPETADRVREALRRRFPKLRQPASEDICYATRNRQQAVKALAAQAELVLVLGSANSSNSRRLVETAQGAGARACLVSTREELAAVPVEAVCVLGVTSGASTPESFLEETLSALRARGFATVEHLQAVDEPLRTFRPVKEEGV